MNNKFDQLTKSIAQSVTRRGALKKFGVGLAGMALACLGLASKAQAGPPMTNKKCYKQCMATCVGDLVSCQSFCAFQCIQAPLMPRSNGGGLPIGLPNGEPPPKGKHEPPISLIGTLVP